MKKTTTSASGESDDSRIKRLLDELETAVAELPLEEMVDTVKLHDGPKCRLDDDRTEVIASNMIKLLAVTASLGSSDSVRSLRHLGMLVTQTLMSLAQIEREKPKQDEKKSEREKMINYSEHLSMLFGHERPTLTIRGDLSQINAILARGSGMIAASSPDSINRCVESRSFMDTNNHLVVNVEQLFEFPIDKESDTNKSIHDDTIELRSFLVEHLKRMDRAAGDREKPRDPEKLAMSPESSIHEIVRRMMASRLLDIIETSARETVVTIAAESVTWPVLASALEYKQPEIFSLLDSLHFGENLPFRLRRTGAAGKPRSFKPGTQAAFALEYCLELNATREAYKYSTAEELEKLKEKVSEIEHHRASTPPYKLGPPNFGDGGQRRAYRDGLWAYKAALLPPFPSVSSGQSSRSKNAFKEWYEVAMLRAESLCFSDWENYPWWPACVTSRAGWDDVAKRHRTAEETVREKLKKGMKKLQPTNSDPVGA